MDVDVSIIVPFHSEGALADKTLDGLERNVHAASQAGIRTETIAILDAADEPTRARVQARADRPLTRIETVEVRDLGLARNIGVRASQGKLVLMLDGDDFLGSDFIPRAWSTQQGRACAVWHPAMIVAFGAARNLCYQWSSDTTGFDPRCMLRANPWNACVIAPRQTFLEIPYEAADASTRIGFEDWQWNCETLARGIAHQIVPGTVHFVRKKTRGSLNEDFARLGSTFGPTRLFEKQP